MALPESDQATVTEFFVRHGDHLTNTTVVTDPVFLTEPEVRTNDFYPQSLRPPFLALCLRRWRASGRESARQRAQLSIRQATLRSRILKEV